MLEVKKIRGLRKQLTTSISPLSLDSTSDSKETTDVMGLKVEAEHLIWILDSDKELAGVIAAISQSLEQTENTIRLSAVVRSKIEERF